MAKSVAVERQLMLGAVPTAEGIPIPLEVIDGNVDETRTLQPTPTILLKCFAQGQRLILGADCDLLSLDILDALNGIEMANGRSLAFSSQYTVGATTLWYSRFRLFHCTQRRRATEPVTDEQTCQGLCLIVTHDAIADATQTQRRDPHTGRRLGRQAR